MQALTRDEFEAKRKQDVPPQVIEVLGKEEFEREHLPGARNVPLGEDFEKRIEKAVPDKETEVVLYCANTECPASEKAAKRMEALGYRRVYDYAEGKAGWKAAGLPTES